jgi:hypothetical protein
VKRYLFGSSFSMVSGVAKSQAFVKVPPTIWGLRCFEAGIFPKREKVFWAVFSWEVWSQVEERFLPSLGDSV